MTYTAINSVTQGLSRLHDMLALSAAFAERCQTTDAQQIADRIHYDECGAAIQDRPRAILWIEAIGYPTVSAGCRTWHRPHVTYRLQLTCNGEESAGNEKDQMLEANDWMLRVVGDLVDLSGVDDHLSFGTPAMIVMGLSSRETRHGAQGLYFVGVWDFPVGDQ